VATPGQQQDRWRQLEAIFQAALDLEPDHRSDYLTSACGADLELRGEVESLLKSARDTVGFLATPIQDAARGVAGASAQPGRRIGSYEILRVLGEGGMGTVFLAARADEHYRRQVAIKLMHAGLGYSVSMQARFRAERQILANLDHPNIARLLDGGLTSFEEAGSTPGVPYLVMEYVDGVTIDVYCREHRLKLDDRLRLFLTMCAAVEYAHNNLVVHRDIKPANILVSSAGVPKLLDFGIAKLLDPEFGSEEAPRSRATEHLMTPEYASPEQIRGEPVTTSTDVHGLGMLLYELLTGRRPFLTSGKSPLETARIICEQLPESPSAAAHTSSSLPVAEVRKLKGDLDNIVLMAMRKEPDRRYASVAQLAADVRAYMNGYPLVARTDHWLYRSQKFVRRHRAGVAAGVLAVFALVGFSIAMGVLARRATREQQIAQRQAQFLSDMFQASTPEEARGSTITARDLLDRGAQRVDKEFAAQPEVRASLLENIAQAYESLGVLDQAQKLAERSYTLRSQISGPDSAGNAGVLDLLATVIRLQGDYPKAEPFFRRLVAIRRRATGEDNLDFATALSDLGECLYLENKDSEAETILRQSLAIHRRLGPDFGPATRNYLALLLERKGEYPEAAQLLSEAAEIDRRTRGGDSPEYATALHNFGSALIDAGDLRGAEAKLREALAIRRKVLPANHPNLFYSLNNLAFVLLNEGDWQGGEPFAREALALTEKSLGEQHPLVASSRNGLARVLEAKSDFPAASQQFRLALDILHSANQSDGWSAAQITLNLAMLDLDRGEYAEAERLSRQSLERFQKLGGNDTPAVATALIELAEDRLFQGDPKAAEPLLRQAVKIRQEKFRPGHPAIIFAQTRLGEELVAADEAAQAEPILRQAVAMAQKPEFPLPAWQVAEPEDALAGCLQILRRQPEAEKWRAISQVPLQTDPRPAFRVPASERLNKLAPSSRDN
jgi:serine/threonine-protein kinase